MLLNGRPLALRGTIDCAQFPLKGYPPVGVEIWRERMWTLKRYGLNYVRFHAWCPPEAAFQAADIYLQVEMPLWINRDIGMPEFGDDPIHRAFLRRKRAILPGVLETTPAFCCFPAQMRVWAILNCWKTLCGI